jgi:hypothetical protein
VFSDPICIGALSRHFYIFHRKSSEQVLLYFVYKRVRKSDDGQHHDRTDEWSRLASLTLVNFSSAASR